MLVLGKRKCKEFVSEVLYSQYYRDNQKLILWLIRLSRIPFLLKNRWFLYFLQMNIANTLTGFEQAILKGRNEKSEIQKQLEQAKQEEKTRLLEKIEDYERCIKINKQIKYEIKIVADGIAWRNLNYNRPKIRILSDNQSTASVNVKSKSFQAVRKIAYKLTRFHKNRVIINDLTRMLNIGDITEIINGDIILNEIKSKKKIELNNIFTVKKELSVQVSRMINAQKSILTGEVKLKNNNMIKFMEINLKPKTYHKKIVKIIKTAIKNRVGSVLLDNFLYVKCINFNVIKDDEDIKLANSYNNLEKCQWYNEASLVFSNFDSFYFEGGEFMRNIAPYTIYPFSSKLILKLINGSCLLMSKIKFSALEENFKKAGWDMKIINFQPQEINNREKSSEILNHSVQETTFILKKGNFNLGIPFSLISRILYEFLSWETILSLCEYLYKNTNEKLNNDYFFDFKEESEIWN